MGFDLLTSFSPSRGGVTGTDDFYNVPGCMQLDGSQDTSVATRGIAAGTPAASFSAIPLISEIQSAFGWNQVIALVRRRIQLYNALTGGSHVLPAFVNSGDAPITKLTDNGSVTDSGTLHDAINTIRQGEGLPAYTFIAQFGNSIIRSRKDISGLQLAECRKALRISGLQKLDISLNSIGVFSGPKCVLTGRYLRFDNPYGTPTSESISSFNSTVVGKTSTFSPFRMGRGRALWQYAIPEWATIDPNSATFGIFAAGSVTTLENFVINLYSSNTDDSAFTLGTFNGVAYNTNNLEDNSLTQASFTSVVRNIPFNVSRVAPKANAYLCFIIATANEVAGAGLGIDPSTNKASTGTCFELTSPVILDWGV